jgi:lysophospholipase L1-like esterase
MTSRRRARRLAALALGTVLAALALEGGARVVLWQVLDDAAFQRFASLDQLRARYGAHARVTPHRHLGYLPTPGYVRGDNRHNSLGYRGDEFAVAKPPGLVRVVLAGGSTTYCDGVPHDHRLSHAFMLQARLRQAGLAIEVINAGCPGWTSLETVINFQTRLLDLQPDVLIVYDGFNDVLTRMVWPSSAYRGDLSGWFSRQSALAPASLLDLSALARIVRVQFFGLVPHGDMLRVLGDVEPTNHGFAFRDQWRSGTYPSGVFAHAPIEHMFAANPPVYFERNLRSLAALCTLHQVTLVLATFAVSAEFPEQPFVGHPAFRAAVDEHNDVVRKITRDTGARLFDLAPLLVGDKQLFTDGVHFTAAGNWRRAELMREYLARELGIGR